MITLAGEGSVRDSLSALDQAIACCGDRLEAAEVRALLGRFSIQTLEQVAEALLEGFERLSSPKVPLFGYARALAGLQENFPGGPKLLAEYLPAKAARNLGKGPMAEIQRMKREQFMAQWAKKALNFLNL